ncbi:hypothetical protein AACH06_29545 [Ideonella sp. DXS29W]|uniref:Uncharacterized protein n=1 Tax=Ideonella lacteola TaxID=2984193 RepID=A0ABU9C1N9_9BURK
MAGNDINCSETNAHVQLELIGFPAPLPVQLLDITDGCRRGFEFVESSTDQLAGLIRVSPIELGLNAQNEVYRIAFKDGTAKRIGNIPAGAEPAGDNKFIHIIQQGHSIYKSTYIATETRISLSGESLELVTGGVICAESGRNAYALDISSNTNCKRRIKASHEKPVCLIHSGPTTTQTRLDRCSELSTQTRP